MSEEETRQRLRGQTAQWVAGHFDPLLAEHVRWLGQCAKPDEPLVVEITNPARPLLAQRARAELVAALGMVDYVVLKDCQEAPRNASPDASPDTFNDANITERFIQRVLRRHAAEGTG